ncbi:MAG: hypothetical protein K5668_03885, partial [Lachnospiraceae bacterium]|nr:hypothetical protein [Lachnospiraceae bacterium]
MIKSKWKKLSSIRKKAFAVTLATAVVSTTLNIGSFVVNADTSARGRIITAFEELTDDIAYQELPVGSKLKDIKFPEDLRVTLYSEESGRADDTEESTESSEEASEESSESTESSTEAVPEVTTETPQNNSAPETGNDNQAPAENNDSNSGSDEGSGAGNDDESAPAGNEDSDSSSEGGSNDSGDSDSGSGSTDNSSGSDSGSAGEGGDAGTAGNENEEEGSSEGASLTDVFNPFMPVTVYAAEPEEDEDDSAASEEDEPADDEEPSEESSDDADEDEELYELSDGEERTLEDVDWKLVREKSQYGSRFQAVREGDVFVFSPDIREYGLKTEVPLPEITVTIVAAEDAAESSTEATEEEDESPEFGQFSIIGGVKISVEAPEG